MYYLSIRYFLDFKKCIIKDNGMFLRYHIKQRSFWRTTPMSLLYNQTMKK